MTEHTFELKHIDEEKPSQDEYVIAWNKDKSACQKVFYMVWNEGMGEDEWHGWESDVGSLEWDEWPFWARIELT